MSASCVLHVPEAQGSLPWSALEALYVCRTRTSLGRAVRTAYRGTPGSSLCSLLSCRRQLSWCRSEPPERGVARSSTYSTYSTVELTVPSRAVDSCRARLISGAPGLHTTLLCSRQARHAIANACAPSLPLARRDTRTGARWPRREQGERAFTAPRGAAPHTRWDTLSTQRSGGE